MLGTDVVTLRREDTLLPNVMYEGETMAHASVNDTVLSIRANAKSGETMRC